MALSSFIPMKEVPGIDIPMIELQTPTKVLSKSMDLGTVSLYDLDLLITQTLEDYSNQNNRSQFQQININNDAKEEESIALTDKLNYTDPLVIFDPSIENTIVVTQDMGYHLIDETRKETDKILNEDELTINGIKAPLIKFNNNTINWSLICYCKLRFRGILPELELALFDDGYISKSDPPGLNNRLTFIIMPEIDGAYKKVSLDFYINHYERTYRSPDNRPILLCYCSYYLPGMYEIRNEAINYKNIPDRKAKTCELTTYECLYSVAKTLGLGYQVTEDCPKINDKQKRLLFNQNFVEFIQETIDSGGIDEDSIFDAWVDLNNTLNLINVSWVFNQEKKITPEYLSVYGLAGALSNEDIGLQPSFVKVPRTLTNFHYLGIPVNLEFHSKDFEQIQTNIRNEGILVKNTTLNLYRGSESDGINSIVQNDIINKENSVDGRYINEYMVQRNMDVNINFDNFNVTYQKQMHDNFFKTQRASIYKVSLTKINFGLKRGTLISLAYFSTDIGEKTEIIRSTFNLIGDKSIDMPDISKIQLESGKTIQDIITDEDYPLMNFAKSGIYYIDSMEIEYDISYETIVQTLYLIRLGNKSNYHNKHTMAKILNENHEIINRANATNTSSSRLNDDATSLVDLKIFY